MSRKIFKSYGGIAGYNYCYDERTNEESNSIEQHIPNWASVDSSIHSFDSIDELLKIPFVKRRSTDEGFMCYAKSKEILMGIYENGTRWWVIGYIKEPDKVNLPKVEIVSVAEGKMVAKIIK